MQAGKLDQLLTIEEPSQTVASGDATIVHTERGTAWAAMEWIGGTRAGVEVGAAFRFTIRHRTDVAIAAGWQLGLKGTIRKFRITAQPADPDGRRRELVILANEVALPARVTA